MNQSPFEFVLENNQPEMLQTEDDRYFMKALTAAQNVMGTTHPNPSVGAVLVKDNKIISVGHTHPVGGMHAEAHAISEARGQTEGASLYVTLEPCSHFGRTPPCTNAVIEAKIARVVFGVTDPNPVVCGAGIKALTNAGIVVEQVRRPELLARAQALIIPFTTWLFDKRPFVTVKVATFADGTITSSPGVRTKITHSSSDIVVHELRKMHDAILIGAQTARIDNPQLTARIGVKRLHQPTRIVMSTDLNLPLDLALFDTSEAKTLVLTTDDADKELQAVLIKRGVDVVCCAKRDGRVCLQDGLRILAEKGFTSVLVEAGASLLESFIVDDCANIIWWFKSAEQGTGKGISIASSVETVKKNYGKKTFSLPVDELTIFSKKLNPR